jgi:hypothetical protein
MTATFGERVTQSDVFVAPFSWHHIEKPDAYFSLITVFLRR